MLFLLPTPYITLIPTPYDSNQNRSVFYFKICFKLFISCLCIIDIDLGFMVTVDYMHTD